MKHLIFVMTAPSGTGKTTLSRTLIKQDPQLRLSVSHTTRTPRSDEIEGQDYHFVSPVQFRRMIEEGVFIEHALVHQHDYGTSRVAMNTILQKCDVLLEIDWQGAAQIRRLYPKEGIVDIFILPPSFEVLERRLSARAKDHQGVIAQRMEMAWVELSHAQEFQYLVVNDDLEKAIGDTQAIVRAARLRYTQQTERHASFL